MAQTQKALAAKHRSALGPDAISALRRAVADGRTQWVDAHLIRLIIEVYDLKVPPTEQT